MSISAKAITRIFGSFLDILCLSITFVSQNARAETVGYIPNTDGN